MSEQVVVETTAKDPKPDEEAKPTALAVVEPIKAPELAVVPGASEMQTLVQLAVTMAAAHAVPKPLRDRPNDVLLVLLTGRDLGIALTTALREVHIIEGRPTISPKMKLAKVREQGLGKVWPDPANDATKATWYGVRSDDPSVTITSTFTMEDAKRAGVNNKDNWKHYPQRMLSWRALGYLLDDTFTEIGTGLYQPDEIGAVTDEDGAPLLDATAIDPPAGMSAPRNHQSASSDPSDWFVANGWPGGKAEEAAFAEATQAILRPLSDEAKQAMRTWLADNGVNFANVHPRPYAEAVRKEAERLAGQGTAQPTQPSEAGPDSSQAGDGG